MNFRHCTNSDISALWHNFYVSFRWNRCPSNFQIIYHFLSYLFQFNLVQYQLLHFDYNSLPLLIFYTRVNLEIIKLSIDNSIFTSRWFVNLWACLCFSGDFSLQIRDARIEDDALYQCQVGATSSEPGIRSRLATLTVVSEYHWRWRQRCRRRLGCW